LSLSVQGRRAVLLSQIEQDRPCRPQHRPPHPSRRTARLGPGRPDRHQHEQCRTPVPLGQARLGRLRWPARNRQPRRHL